MVRPFLEDPELNKALHDNSPWPSLGTAQDVADAAVFLASDESRWVTGATSRRRRRLHSRMNRDNCHGE